jgi:hypothetical protein
MRPNLNMAVLIDRQCCCQKRNETQEQRWRRAGRFRRMRASGDAWQGLEGLGCMLESLTANNAVSAAIGFANVVRRSFDRTRPFPIAPPNVDSAASKSASTPRRHRR